MRVLGGILIVVGVFFLMASLATWRPYAFNGGFNISSQFFIGLGSAMIVGGAMMFRKGGKRSD